MRIILASTSPYRRQLLKRLAIDFDCEAPAVEENRIRGESPDQMALRLATAKALAVATRHPDAMVIGSDQVAALDDIILGKPGSHAKAVAQLRASSGRRVDFFTGVALISDAGRSLRSQVETFSVYFRTLSDEEIIRYVDHEKPFDCAGSFKWEGLGISLFERLQGNDPTSLEGLPLIALCQLLRESGVDVPPAFAGPDSDRSQKASTSSN
tara:strand:- start:26853 stop:27485 length:633 start_codon:yes stop_codon:yes gene_type:complete